MDVHRTDQFIEEPAILKVGKVGATEIAEIIHGSITIPAITGIVAQSSKSASAAFTGLTADHKVVLMPQAWAAEPTFIAAAKGIAGGIQLTAVNTSGVSATTTTQSANFFAWK